MARLSTLSSWTTERRAMVVMPEWLLRSEDATATVAGLASAAAAMIALG